MLPHKHLIYGTIFFGILYYLFPKVGFFPFFIAWLTSWFFIDLDHPIRFTIKTKSLNPIRFCTWSIERHRKWKKLKEKSKYKFPVFIFHGIEFLLILLILAQFWTIFYFVMLGALFHLFCDYIDLFQKKMPFYSKMSQVMVWVKNKNKKEFKF